VICHLCSALGLLQREPPARCACARRFRRQGNACSRRHAASGSLRAHNAEPHRQAAAGGQPAGERRQAAGAACARGGAPARRAPACGPVHLRSPLRGCAHAQALPGTVSSGAPQTPRVLILGPLAPPRVCSGGVAAHSTAIECLLGRLHACLAYFAAAAGWAPKHSLGRQAGGCCARCWCGRSARRPAKPTRTRRRLYEQMGAQLARSGLSLGAHQPPHSCHSSITCPVLVCSLERS